MMQMERITASLDGEDRGQWLWATVTSDWNICIKISFVRSFLYVLYQGILHSVKGASCPVELADPLPHLAE